MKTVFAVIGFVVVALIVGTCVACNDDDSDNNGQHSLGVTQLAYHDGGDNGCWDGECYDGDGDGDGYHERYHQNYGSRDDRNRSRNRNRGAFSPGPFDRSPVTIIVCPPGTQYCGSDGGRGQEPPPDEGGYA